MLLYAVGPSNNKWLLIVDGEFFLFLSCNTEATLFQQITSDRQKFRMNCVISYLWIFQHNVGTEGIDKQTTWKFIRRRYQDKAKVKVPWQL